MPDDSVIRIRQTLDLTDFKAKSAESRAIVAAQVAELKGQYAQAAIEARATLTDLAHAEKTFGAEAAAGNQKATETIEQHREMVAEARAEYARLGGEVAKAKAQLAEMDAQAKQAAASTQTVAAATTAVAGATRQAGAGFAAARVEVGAFTGNVGSLEGGMARLALQSSALGPAMREALPIAIALGFEEIVGRLVTHFRDLTEELTGLKELRETQNQAAESTHRLFLELVKAREANVKVSAEGLEGTRKLNTELSGMAPILHDIGAQHQKALREVEDWQARVHGLQLAYDQAGGVLNGFNTLRKRDMDEAAARLKEEQTYVRELEGAYQSLAERTHAAHAEIPVEAEKASLADRKAAIESVQRFEADNYQLRIENIASEAEAQRLARDNAVADARASFNRVGEVAAAEANTEATIIQDTLRRTLEANQQEYAAAVAKYDGLRALAQEKGRTGANVKPEIEGINAAEFHEQAELVKRDTEAMDAAMKSWAKDAKESGDAVTRMLADVARAQEQDSTAAREAAKKEFEERIRDIKEEAKLEIDTRRAMLDETLRTMNIDRQMSIGKAQEEIALVRQAAAEEIRIRAQEAAQLRAMGVTDAAQYKAIQDQKVQIARQAARQIEDIQRQEYQQLKQVFDEMASTFNTALNQMITHQRTFAQAAREMWNGLVMDVIKQIEKMVEQWIAQHVIMAVIHKVFAAQTAAVDTSATATKVAQNNAANVAIGLSDAAVGAAAAFASVIEALPFPANIAAAPPVAAGVYATIAGMASAGSFEHGGIIPGPVGMPTGVTAHGGEMFLGTKLSQTVQNMASSGGSTRAGATSHVRMNINPTFISRTEFSDSDIRNHSKEIARAVKNEWAQFNR
jgi:hypothetical protein